MSVWSSIGGAICVAVSALGLVWSWRIWRKNGAASGTRAVAWSLLPLAAYLVGAVGLLGRLVNAVVRFAGAFVFSPKTWAGVIVVGIAAVLFLTSGGLPLMNWRKNKKRRKVAGGEDASGGSRAAVPAGQQAPEGRKAVEPRRAKATVPGGSDDDDMKDVQEILRRRGIS
jgi:hypothetical protein